MRLIDFTEGQGSLSVKQPNQTAARYAVANINQKATRWFTPKTLCIFWLYQLVYPTRHLGFLSGVLVLTIFISGCGSTKNVPRIAKGTNIGVLVKLQECIEFTEFDTILHEKDSQACVSELSQKSLVTKAVLDYLKNKNIHTRVINDTTDNSLELVIAIFPRLNWSLGRGTNVKGAGLFVGKGIIFDKVKTHASIALTFNYKAQEKNEQFQEQITEDVELSRTPDSWESMSTHDKRTAGDSISSVIEKAVTQAFEQAGI